MPMGCRAGAGVECAGFCGGGAVRLVLVDCGNGVTRIEGVERAEVPGEGWEDVDWPLPGRVVDALGVALAHLGVEPCGCEVRARAQVEAAGRAVYVVWGVG